MTEENKKPSLENNIFADMAAACAAATVVSGVTAIAGYITKNELAKKCGIAGVITGVLTTILAGALYSSDKYQEKK